MKLRQKQPNLVRSFNKGEFWIHQHSSYYNCSSFSERNYFFTIFMDQVKEIKSFKLGPSRTLCNLAFGIELSQKLQQVKLMMGHTLIILAVQRGKTKQQYL